MNRPTPSATEAVGQRLADAIATADGDALRALLATPVAFRAVTPRRYWDAEDPAAVEEVVLGTWFAGKTVTDVQVHEEDAVGGVGRFGYRMQVATPDGPRTIEQVGYYETEGGLVTRVRLVCSGFVAG